MACKQCQMDPSGITIEESAELIFHRHDIANFDSSCRFDWAHHPNATKLLSILDVWIVEHKITDHSKAALDLLDWEQLRNRLDGIIDDGKWRKKHPPLLLAKGPKAEKKIDDVVLEKIKEKVKSRMAHAGKEKNREVEAEAEEQDVDGKKGEEEQARHRVEDEDHAGIPQIDVGQRQEPAHEHGQEHSQDQDQSREPKSSRTSAVASLAPRFIRGISSVGADVASAWEAKLDEAKCSLLNPKPDPQRNRDMDPECPPQLQINFYESISNSSPAPQTLVSMDSLQRAQPDTVGDKSQTKATMEKPQQVQRDNIAATQSNTPAEPENIVATKSQTKATTQPDNTTTTKSHTHTAQSPSIVQQPKSRLAPMSDPAVNIRHSDIPFASSSVFGTKPFSQIENLPPTITKHSITEKGNVSKANMSEEEQRKQHLEAERISLQKRINSIQKKTKETMPQNKGSNTSGGNQDKSLQEKVRGHTIISSPPATTELPKQTIPGSYPGTSLEDTRGSETPSFTPSHQLRPQFQPRLGSFFHTQTPESKPSQSRLETFFQTPESKPSQPHQLKPLTPPSTNPHHFRAPAKNEHTTLPSSTPYDPPMTHDPSVSLDLYEYSAENFLSSLPNPNLEPLQKAATQLRRARDDLAKKKKKLGPGEVEKCGIDR